MDPVRLLLMAVALGFGVRNLQFAWRLRKNGWCWVWAAVTLITAATIGVEMTRGW